MGVENHPDRIFSASDSAGKRGIVREYRSDSRQDHGAAAAVFMDMLPGFLAGDPFGCAAGRRGMTVGCHRYFHGDERSSVSDSVKEISVERFAFLFQDAGYDIESRVSEDLGAARRLRVRIGRADNDAADAGFQYRFGARTGPPGVRAGFQRHVNCRAVCFDAGVSESYPLRMGTAGLFMPALTDDAAVVYDDGSDHRIGRSCEASVFCKTQRKPHCPFICSLFVSHCLPFQSNRPFSVWEQKSPAGKRGKKEKCSEMQCIPEQDRRFYPRNIFVSRADIASSSFIQTVLSASESHRIMPCGSWALPPVGNFTLP